MAFALHINEMNKSVQSRSVFKNCRIEILRDIKNIKVDATRSRINLRIYQPNILFYNNQKGSTFAESHKTDHPKIMHQVFLKKK